MIKVFKYFSQCYFHVRANRTLQFGNGYTSEHPLPQKEILSKTNTKVFISHCGQNSVTESMYAGVPLICIPKSGDQKYNASIVESKGVGIYVDYEDLKDSTESLGAALYQILCDEYGNFNYNSKYTLAAEKMRRDILENYDPETFKTMKDKFLGKFDGTY
uniref:glucuronosyltransferase n=1 Tax=Meloidogyne enterolobii TaxID=390850 RepID=A0A6V7VH02_MELEN|nr:unnamed protein product [Meloidogyne enterolobii]